MDITFADRNLEKYANDDKKATRKLGHDRARLYKQRLDDISAVSTLEDVRHLPGEYHELKGERKGQWSTCSLDHPY